jgi:transcriptional regulator with XRE-family HTH domain
MESTFGKNLRKHRELQGLSQTELSKKLCVSQKTIHKWETVHTCPTINIRIAVSEMLGVPLDVLMGNPEWVDL